MATRGIRNNNPLNIRNNEHTHWKGEVNAIDKNDKSFEEFESMQHGYRAAFVCIRTYVKKYGLRTISQIINRWAPPNENHTEIYLMAVCKDLNISPDSMVEINNKNFMINLAAAMFRVENGSEPDITVIEEGWNLFEKT